MESVFGLVARREPKMESVFGLVAIAALIPLLVEHVKAATLWMLVTVFSHGMVSTSGAVGNTQPSPWQLVADLVAVGMAFLMWDAGLLGDIASEVGVDGDLRWSTVVVIGLLIAGVVSRGYDLAKPTVKTVAGTKPT